MFDGASLREWDPVVQSTCRRCGLKTEAGEEHCFYAWDITHECGHAVTYRAICDAHAFSSPQIGSNTLLVMARLQGEPCPWCGGEVKPSGSLLPRPDVTVMRLVADDRIAHLLAFKT